MKSARNEAVRRARASTGPMIRCAKRFAPFALILGATAARCYAGTSPVARWFNDLSAEATGTWAIAGAVVGLVIGLLGIKFGGHEAKGKMVTLSIIAFALLSVQAIVTYLQGE